MASGFKKGRNKGRSERSNWRKPFEEDKLDSVKKIESNPFCLLEDEANNESSKNSEQKETPITIKIDADLVKYFSKRKKQLDDLKRQMSDIGVNINLVNPNCVRMSVRKSEATLVENWKEKGESIVRNFCITFYKQRFQLDKESEEWSPEWIEKIQNRVSSYGAACWINKNNLILVSASSEYDKALNDVREAMKNAGCFVKRCFPIQKAFFSKIERNLSTLKETVKSSSLTLERKTLNLIICCLKTDVDDVVRKVESFIRSHETTDGINYPRQKNYSTSSKFVKRHLRNSGMIQNNETSQTSFRPPVKHEPFSLKVSNDVVKFVMNNTRLKEDLENQLEKLNGKLEWKPGIPYITVMQKSEHINIPKWSDVCRVSANRFLQRFRRESYEMQDLLKESVSKNMKVLKEKLLSFEADCWLASNGRWLVVVVEKSERSSVVGIVEQFLQSVKEECEEVKGIVEFLPVSKDHMDYIEYTNILEEIKRENPGLVDVSLTEAKDQIYFEGCEVDVSKGKQQFEEFVGKVNITELYLSNEKMEFLSKKPGLEYFEKCLSDEKIDDVLLVASTPVLKIVTQSMEELQAVKQCIENNIQKVVVDFPQENEHLWKSKTWIHISTTIDSEELVEWKKSDEDVFESWSVIVHGATFLVEKYTKLIKNFIDSSKIESCTIDIEPEINDFLKKRLNKEFQNIELQLKEEEMIIKIDEGKVEISGTRQGIEEAKSRVIKLKDEVKTETKSYTSVGSFELLFNEHGERNIKVIEVSNDVTVKLTLGDKENIENFDINGIRTLRDKTSKDEEALKYSFEPFDNCNFITNEGLKVSWKYGDLANETADIIVNSAVSNLGNPTALGRVLERIAGPSYVTECCRYSHIEKGDIAVTNAGNLSCNYVIHAVCCSWRPGGNAEEVLRKLLSKILLECSRRSARTVAMPLLGTGNHRFPENIVLRLMKEEFEKFSSKFPRTSLKHIQLVRYDPGGVRKTKIMKDRASDERTDFVHLIFGCGKESITVQVCGRSYEHISSAFEEIEKFIEDKIITKKINQEKLYDVILKYYEKMKKIVVDNHIRMECENESTISLTGLRIKVIETSTLIKDFINQFFEEEKRLNQVNYISENVQWCYHDVYNNLITYDTKLNAMIEIARMDGKATVEITERNGHFIIDFSKMQATNKLNGETMKLKRKLLGATSDFSVPSNWSPQSSNQIVSLVKLTPTSVEYIEVQNHFLACGGSPNQLYEIHRIQNPQLYSRYQAFKNSMRGNVNEMRLFHGTSADNIDSINTNNFSRSFAGVNGVSYGNGVYFAKNASYSIQYARKGNSCSKPKMYIAKVLVGDYTRGKSGMKAPPSKNDPENPGLLYDSVVDNTNNPTMYVIFQDNQYYPEYLLTLQ